MLNRKDIDVHEADTLIQKYCTQNNLFFSCYPSIHVTRNGNNRFFLVEHKNNLYTLIHYEHFTKNFFKLKTKSVYMDCIQHFLDVTNRDFTCLSYPDRKRFLAKFKTEGTGKVEITLNKLYINKKHVCSNEVKCKFLLRNLKTSTHHCALANINTDILLRVTDNILEPNPTYCIFYNY